MRHQKIKRKYAIYSKFDRYGSKFIHAVIECKDPTRTKIYKKLLNDMSQFCRYKTIGFYPCN